MKSRSRRVGILSLGCPRNLVDSESILGRLDRKGHRISDIEGSEYGIINTCAFTEEAKRESIDAILELIELKKKGSIKKIIVYGCLVERYGSRLRQELPEVDAFVGRVSLDAGQEFFRITPAHFAYLKICEGCVNNCSYCIIPKIKKGLQSLDIESLINRVKLYDERGVSELNVIGQDITGYGIDLYSKPELAKLVRRILKESRRIKWIRLLYMHPGRVDDGLLKLIRDEERLCKYIDLPIQHINSRILKKMNRHARGRDIRSLIDKIRKVIPEAAIRTSLIVGFPSETDSEFRELLDFVGEIKFERLGVFIYSREEGTPAYAYKGQVPKKVKGERFDAIMSAQQQISAELNKKLLGKTIDVLIDEADKDAYIGRSQYDAPEVDGVVYVRSDSSLKPGDIVKVGINDTLEYDLIGGAIK